MKSYKQMVNEVLNKMTPLETWIDDFVHSKNAKFAGKSTAERIAMAKGAYYAKQRRESVEEAAAVSQNSIATTDMNEDHLVHVSDGSGYDETPHKKDIEHIKTGAMHTGGQWHGHSDKGAFFKFKSKEDAEQFKRHVDKCPHKSCYADHVNEAVEYKGIGTDVVDKKKKLNPQPNFTMAKKQVKDFKEEVQVEEGKVYDPITKKMVATKPIKVQAGGGATRNGVPVETGPSKYKERPSRPGDIYGKSFTENYDHGPIDRDAKVGVGHKAAVLAGSGLDSGKHGTIVGSSKERTGDMWHIKTASGDIVKMHKHRVAKLKEEVELIDELSKDTLASYAKKASHDARIKQHVAADFKSKEAHARNPRKKETWGSIAKKYQSKAWKREDGHDKAVDKLAKEEVQIDELSKGLVARYANKVAKTTQDNYDKSKDKFQFSSNRQDGMKNAVKRLTKEESEQIDEVSKSTLMRYIPKASRDVGSHTYAGKEAGEWANHYTRAGDWSAAEKHSKKSYADFKKANKRIAGIDTATKKLGTQKEEVEPVDEAIAKKLPVQHAVDAVHATLGPKSATRFLSHLSPGSDKHTSWDKVNSALMKQGVQTHHIASIAQKTSHMNEAYTDKEYQSAINAYLKKGGKVETLPTRKPRPSEKTFINRTGSIWKKGYTKSAVSGFNNKSQTTVDDRNKHIREDSETVEESRGHKVLATFFKNREVAQRAYQGNPAKDAEVAQGGGTPADQGIAAAKKDAEELKKKVNEVKAPVVHAAPPKKTKSTAKEYASASIPGTKRVAHAKPDDNEVGGGTATRIAEDQYTSEYKIKSYVDPVTGENKTRKIRPHRINFKASKMHGEPAQQDALGDYGIKEGFDDYSSIAKELVKRHGKNVTAQHVKDFAGERDTHRGLDHAEVMHHVKKLSEDDKVYDEKWKKVKFTDFIKGAK